MPLFKNIFLICIKLTHLIIEIIEIKQKKNANIILDIRFRY